MVEEKNSNEGVETEQKPPNCHPCIGAVAVCLRKEKIMTEETEVIEKTKAEWVAKSYHPYTGVVIACSACQGQICHHKPNPKFCPNCGAEMTNPESTPKDWGRALDSF